jgi:hypothetical protein
VLGYDPAPVPTHMLALADEPQGRCHDHRAGLNQIDCSPCGR